MLSIFDDRDSTGNYSIPEGDEGVTTLALLDKGGDVLRKYNLLNIFRNRSIITPITASRIIPLLIFDCPLFCR